MSVLAGFDLVAEVSSTAILTQLGSTPLMVSGMAAPITLAPPFELRVPLTDDGSSYAHLIVTDLGLTFTEQDATRHPEGTSAAIDLSFSFQDSSVIAPDTPPGPYRDTFSIQHVPVVVSPVGDPIRATLTDYSGVRATAWIQSQALVVDFSSPDLRVSALFLTPEQKATIESYIRSRVGRQPLPVRLATVVGEAGPYDRLGIDGVLAPPNVAPIVDPSVTLPSYPWFRHVEVHAIGAGTLGIFGILLAGHDRDGDHRRKTSTAIAAGHQACVSLGWAAFHRLLFCPAVSRAFSRDAAHPADLPTFCGTNPVGLDVGSGVILTDITSAFHAGRVEIRGRFEKTIPCADVHARFTVPLTLSVFGTAVSIASGVPDVHLDVTGEVLCWLAWPITSWWETEVGAVAHEIASDTLQDKLGHLPATTFAALPGVLLDGVTIDDSAVEPHLTMQGRVFSPMRMPPVRDIQVTTDPIVSRRVRQRATGTYHSQTCPEGDFPYTEWQQSQTLTAHATPHFLVEPVTLTWWIASDRTPDRVTLDPRAVPHDFIHAVSASIPVQMTYPVRGLVVQDATIYYAFADAGRTVVLTNNSLQGNYEIYLGVTAVDIAGNSVERGRTLRFAGDPVDFGKHYTMLLEQCLEEAVRRLRGEDVPQQRNWPTPPGDPGEVRQRIIRSLATLRSAGAPDYLRLAEQAYMAYGRSLTESLARYGVPTAVVRTVEVKGK